MKFFPLLLFFLWTFTGLNAAERPIVLAQGEDRVLQTVAADLSEHLQKLYPADTFPVKTGGEGAIFLGTRGQLGDLGGNVPEEGVDEPGEFSVINDGSTVIISGHDAGAIRDGVYSMLEELGFGFYLTFTSNGRIDPDAQFEPTQWEMTDKPTILERPILNWHNFLTGCSTWDEADWKDHIRRIARMRYNALVVHNYTNNPMLEFEFAGVKKPVGWINNTRKGRTYAVEHVWDVRDLPGGKGMFGEDEKVFGTDEGLVPDEQHPDAIKAMMGRVFDYAKDWGLDIIYFIDIDTYPAHPQEMIEATIPEEDRFYAAKTRHWIARPDQGKGYEFHKTWMAQLMRDYPQLDRIAVWCRFGGTPGMEITTEDLPEDWLPDYQRIVDANPEITDFINGYGDTDRSAAMYYYAQVWKAWKRAMEELGSETQVCWGSWTRNHPKFLSAHKFIPEGVPVYVLDYGTNFPKGWQDLAHIPETRPMIIFTWAQHDDRSFAGAPLKPFNDLADLAEGYGITGVGIKHWLTRPLDPFFVNTSDQLWESTRGKDWDETLREMGVDLAGTEAGEAFGQYLDDWGNGDNFGMETSDEFLNERYFKKPEQVERLVKRSQERQAQLEALQGQVTSPEAQAWVRYFLGFEEWMREVAKEQHLRHTDDVEQMKTFKPTRVIQLYADAALQAPGGITEGDKGLVTTMHTRWLPYFVAKQQKHGLAPLRVNYQPTNHGVLARKPGKRTFLFDSQGEIWWGAGEVETGYPASAEEQENYASDVELIAASWIESPQKMELKLTNIIGEDDDGAYPQGAYDVALVFPASARGAYEIQVEGQALGEVTFPGGQAHTETFTGIELRDETLNLTITSPETIALGGVIARPGS